MSKKPNIVFILNDHQPFYRHGWDGGPIAKRPYFDKLAQDGIEFSRSYCCVPLCGPARRSMLTGLYPHSHGETRNNVDHPYDREVYLDTLAGGGYKNFYYGKWHAGPGTAKDHRCEGFSYPSYNNPYTKPEYKDYLKRYNLPEPEILIEHSFLRPDKFPDIQKGNVIKQNRDWCNEHAAGVMQTPNDTHEAFFLANLACEKLEELAKVKDGNPFHLRVDFWGPHPPYFPTKEFAAMYKPEDIKEYGSFRDDLKTKPEIYKFENNFGLCEDNKLIQPNPLPWSIWQKVIALAYGQVTLTDAAGGRILDKLEELGLAENTIVIWSTDHGDALACHGGHFDKSAYLPEEIIRVPMAVRYPGKIKAGQKSNALVSNVDIPITILDAAGLKFEKKIHGESILSVSTGGKARENIVCETFGHQRPHNGRALITDRYKYIANGLQTHELYDLQKDPYELTNLIDSPVHKEILEDLKQQLKRWQKQTDDTIDVLNEKVIAGTVA
jgi:arylsulfatase A-like enzyme